MEKITGIVITRNEEKNIERCLNSLVKVTDEIIIVDSFSQDSTQEICLRFETVRFFKRIFDGYGSQKNWALEKVSNPMVLSIDAGESLSDELSESIIKVKEHRAFDAYYCNRLTNYCGHWVRHGGWYPDKKLRLWDIRKGSWDDALIHEKVTIDIGANVGFLKGDLLHYSYYSISEHVLQANRFTDLTSVDAFRKNKGSSAGQILIRPIWKFYTDFFVKLGILDGYHGLVIAAISSFATFLKYVKIYELNKRNLDDKKYSY